MGIVNNVSNGSTLNRLKEKAKSSFHAGKDWIISNKESVLVLAPIVVGGLATVAKVVGRHSNLRKEEFLKDRYCYDRSLGHYWKLRRKLSSKEWVAIDRRKQNGERLADILSELKLLD